MKKVTIYFLNGSNKDTELHYNEKQYRDDVIVELNNKFYEVYFFVRDILEYEMTKDGFFSFPGMVILDEITTEHIYKSIGELYKFDFFDYLISHKELPLENRFMNKWYMNEFKKHELQNVYKHELFLNDNIDEIM